MCLKINLAYIKNEALFFNHSGIINQSLAECQL